MQNFDSKQLAQEKFERALCLIADAQSTLSSACSELSSLEGTCESWELVGNHYDQIHALWRRVAYQTPRNLLDLDEDAKRRLSRQIAT